MNADTSTPTGVSSVIDLTPRAGQSDADIMAWIAKHCPNGVMDGKGTRRYYGQLRNDRPTSDRNDPAYKAWYERLTATQKRIATIAAQQKDRDPKVQAARQAKEERDKAKRAQDPEYQAKLADSRGEYAQRIKAAQGRDVRPYRKGAARLDGKQRNANMRAFIRDELMAGRNPFPADKYNGRDHEVRQETIDRHLAKFGICAILLKSGQIDPSCKETVAKFVDAIGVSDDDAVKLMDSAIETLRTAKAIKRKGGIIYLHDDIIRAHNDTDEEKMKNLEGFGIF